MKAEYQLPSMMTVAYCITLFYELSLRLNFQLILMFNYFLGFIEAVRLNETKKVSEYGQEIPQSHIADQPTHCEEEPQNNNSNNTSG